MYTKYL